MCNHFDFDFDWEKKKSPNSVNIIFNIHESPPKIYIIAGRNTEVKVRRITMNSDFTRIKKKNLSGQVNAYARRKTFAEKKKGTKTAYDNIIKKKLQINILFI